MMAIIMTFGAGYTEREQLGGPMGPRDRARARAIGLGLGPGLGSSHNKYRF